MKRPLRKKDLAFTLFAAGHITDEQIVGALEMPLDVVQHWRREYEDMRLSLALAEEESLIGPNRNLTEQEKQWAAELEPVAEEVLQRRAREEGI